MDGTITRPVIDWADLRRRAQIPEGEQIMPYIDRLPVAAGLQARATVEAIEMEAAIGAELNPGATELLRELRARGWRLALITNNHRAAMVAVVEKFDLQFDQELTQR